MNFSPMIRSAANTAVMYTDINNPGGQLELDNLSRGYATVANIADTFIESISATGIPTVSQTAGTIGIGWGLTKLGIASLLLMAEGFSAGASASKSTGSCRTALSGTKSILLGASTFFPPIGMYANFTSAPISAAISSLYVVVEPITRP